MTGLVQGVGFRPHVYRLARASGLSGWVANDGEGVLLEVQGAQTASFVERLRSESPPLARLETLNARSIPPLDGERGFEIQLSRGTRVRTSITPDAGICDACLAEMLSLEDRRYLYPFLNCTHCGPRYTLTRGLPYDRAMTSMAPFEMCAACRSEYENPLDRRFHAQPVACPACGPQLSEDPRAAVDLIRAGGIVAIKGLGGFHLACDARNHSAVQALRNKKQRGAKPFAVMVPNLASAQQLVKLPDSARAALLDPARPVVLVPTRDGAQISSALAPGLTDLGIMLPYTPLHHLLFYEAAGRPSPTSYLSEPQQDIWVMTSANPGGEALITHNVEAEQRLGPLCDLCLHHDREIVVRADDSVVRPVNNDIMFIRRARGYVPAPIALPRAVPSILALGADLKNTFCLTRGAQAFVSQHIGDLDTASNVTFLRETLAHLSEVLQIKPLAVACDLHPDFVSTRIAREFGLPVVEVQHHHAHIASVAAEHGETGALLGLALDGFGLGPDGGAWGGELLLVAGDRFERLGALAALPLPGGDLAAREPWRMAAAALWRMGRGAEVASRFAAHPPAKHLASVLDAGLGAPLTSSCGRLFDAACGILGILEISSYEGEAPMRMEALVSAPRVLDGGFHLTSALTLDFLPTLEGLLGCPADEGADLFHGTLTAGITAWVVAAREQRGVNEVVLSGGCCLNKTLVEGLTASLEAHGFRVLLPRALPPNDGGLSLGQAWVAAQVFEQRGEEHVPCRAGAHH